MGELRSMQGMLASHLSSMAWLDGVRRNPVQTKVLRHLMACGFSGGLARRLADRLPGNVTDRQARSWLADRLQKVIQVDATGQTVIDRGGIYALTGPTGVGKTTTIAKAGGAICDAPRHRCDRSGVSRRLSNRRTGSNPSIRPFAGCAGDGCPRCGQSCRVPACLHAKETGPDRYRWVSGRRDFGSSNSCARCSTRISSACWYSTPVRNPK